jgi:hypothetical protein
MDLRLPAAIAAILLLAMTLSHLVYGRLDVMDEQVPEFAKVH